MNRHWNRQLTLATEREIHNEIEKLRQNLEELPSSADYDEMRSCYKQWIADYEVYIQEAGYRPGKRQPLVKFKNLLILLGQMLVVCAGVITYSYIASLYKT